MTSTPIRNLPSLLEVMSAGSGQEAAQIQELESVLVDLVGALARPPEDGKQIVVPREEAEVTKEQREQARYKALVEQIPAITFTLSLEEGRPDIYIGPQIERILGFSQEEWMRDPILWFNQCHPEDRQIWHREFAYGIASGGPFKVDTRVFAKNGDIKWLHIEATLVRDDTSKPLFLQGIVFDVTESKEAEQKLKEAQDVKVLNERLNAVGQMAASIGHDLRNPLGAIRNAWFYVKKRLDDGADLSEDKRFATMANVIERELDQCSGIISELLEFSRDREPFRVACPLAPLIDEVFEVVKIPSPDHRLFNDVLEDLRVPHVDLTQFRQILVNLVQNGLEALGTEGEVRVGAHYIAEDDTLVISISDNGIGIPEDLRENIWKPLFTTKAKGTGLGLPIVANIVQRHGGLVNTESAPGQGTTFQLTVPIGEASEGRSAHSLGGPSQVRFLRDAPVSLTPLAMRPLVDEVIDSLSAGRTTAVEVRNEVPEELPVVQLDEREIKRALSSLVQNGIHAVRNEGWVRISANLNRARDRMTLVVEDNGHGIEPSIQESMWEPMFTTKPKGSGQGLPSARRVAERHGGSLELTSEPKVGTTATMELPLK